MSVKITIPPGHKVIYQGTRDRCYDILVTKCSTPQHPCPHLHIYVVGFEFWHEAKYHIREEETIEECFQRIFDTAKVEVLQDVVQDWQQLKAQGGLHVQ